VSKGGPFVPADLWTEVTRMGECWLLVAVLVAPVGFVGTLIVRRTGKSLLSRPRAWRVPWAGFEVFVAFAVFVVGLDVLRGLAVLGLKQSGLFEALYGPPGDSGDYPDATRHLMQMWGYLVAVPVFLAAAAWARVALYPGWRPVATRSVPGLVLAIVAWGAVSVVTLAVHFGVQFTFAGLGWSIEEHPLARPGVYQTPLDRALLVVEACFLAPLVEEVMFRGVLLPWLIGRSRRVWAVLGIGVIVALTATLMQSKGTTVGRGPELFALALVGGWVVLLGVMRRKRRTFGAIYASGALFAVVHSGVWPSPIPLFVLGLGLGWLAVRTRGMFVPAIVHGLFNAVSVLFVLRSG
jgi:membrane protease YdiL (CAAX protease family)